MCSLLGGSRSPEKRLTQSGDDGSNEGSHAFKVGSVVQGFGNHEGCQAHGIAEPGRVDAAGQKEGYVHEHAG